jgi:Pyridine nucleotide-disulphide oxidoreductase
MTPLPAIVVGAGPAGLAASRELARHGVEHVVLEKGNGPGHTWANLYDSLVLHTGKHLSALPGLPFGARTPLFPPRAIFLAYLLQYASLFRLPIRTATPVERIVRENGAWQVTTTAGEIRASVVVMATGIVSNPFIPAFPDRDGFTGDVLHSVEYRRPAPFAGRRVLVVGSGNSAGEIAPELASAGAEVTVSVRSGAETVPLQMLGLPIQYFSVVTSLLPVALQRALLKTTARIGELRRGASPLPRPPAEDGCPDVPLIGFHLIDAIRNRAIRLAPALESFTAQGVRFADGSPAPFDAVILATGYRAALAPLGGLVSLDRCGFALRDQRVASREHQGLFFVGQTYDRRGALFNIGWDARRVGRIVTSYLSNRHE